MQLIPMQLIPHATYSNRMIDAYICGKIKKKFNAKKHMGQQYMHIGLLSKDNST